MGLHRAGFEVVGFDTVNQPRYPFEFHEQDALTVDLNGFDAVWASPPCQFATTMRARHQNREYPNLIVPTRELLEESFFRPYIIENVVGSPLIAPLLLCGSMFPELLVKRHRLFESRYHLEAPSLCDHDLPRQFSVYEHGRWSLWRFVPVYGHGGGKANQLGNQAMGIDWMTRAELTQAVPSVYSEYLGRQLMKAL